MGAIALLGAVKLFIDIMEGGTTAAVKGIITSVIPGSDIYTIASSVNYLFDLNGNYSGEIDIEKYETYTASKFNFSNQSDLNFALSNHDFPSLAKKRFEKLNNINFKNREFPTF
jgi:hypothetical protein